MKTLLITLLLLFTFNSYAQQPDDKGWLFVKHKNIPMDTQAHMLGGFVVGGTSSLFWREKTDSFWLGVLGGTVNMFAFGCFKEWTDVNKGGKWSWNDIGYGTGSGFVGSFVFNLRASSVLKSREIERLNQMIEEDNKFHELELN